MVQNSNLLDGSKWDDDDIVISGISARLPNCDSVEEFREKLSAKIDLITDEPRRFQNGLYGAIERYGLLKDLSTFDAKFFNIHPKQAERMDPQIRNLLEVAFEATIDSGLHPDDLKGSRTGVVVGVASSETQDKWSQMPDRINGYEYTGCTRTMFANRVSYFLDLKGPSYSIDTASSTTLVAFQQAYDMIKDGVCDSCFVCGTDLVLNPCVCLMFQCLNMLSPEGKCKAFDIGGDGYVRSEGVVAILLQKAKIAKRVYAKVLAAGSNCDGYKDEGITFPSGAQQVKLFRKVANLAGVDPSKIDFMEAHGSATRVGDPQEMNAVTEVFVKGRDQPLRTGSIKSNMGHAEPASALSAVIKVCVSMESGILPPNLHYNRPNPDVPALLDGRLKVITEPTPWDGGLVAVNSFGVGGANGHALLLSNQKIKPINPDNMPRLICVSGVTENAVNNMLNKVYTLPNDPELYALLNNVFRKNINGHDYRGCMILSRKSDLDIKRITRNFKQNLCLIFPGIESNWKSTGSDLFNLMEFQISIKNCENTLKSAGNNINLKNILRNLNTEKSILNVILGVVSLQIGLVDVLRSIDLEPDFVFGFNIGKIACDYADNRYTLQQAVLTAFHIGAMVQRFAYSSAIIKADVAATLHTPPSDVSILAKITNNCTYYSGPKQSIENFSKTLTSKGINCKVTGSNSLDIAGILKSSKNVSKLTNNLEQILNTSKQSTNKWLSYAVNKSNATSCVSFIIESLTEPSSIQEVTNYLQHSFILYIGFEVEGEILQKTNSSGLPLFHSQADIYGLISTIGKLYNLGFQPQIQNLYPKVQFPVSHGTPMIQSMIEWDHSVKWNVVSFAPKNGRTAGEVEVVVDFDKEEFAYLPGNYLNQQHVLPKSFYIVLLWRAISRLQVKNMTEIPLVIENISFIREITIPEDGPVTFGVNILNVSNKFEIWKSGTIVASGIVNIPTNPSKERIPKKFFNQNLTIDSEICKSDIYNDLKIKHYNYSETFQQLESIDYQNNASKVVNHNWCTFLESFFQISILGSDFSENNQSVISFVRKIVLNPENVKNNETMDIKYSKEYNALQSEYLEMRGIKLKTQACIKKIKPKLESYKFVPFFGRNVSNACEISLQLAVQNWLGHNELKIAELSCYNTYDSLLSPKLFNENPAVSTDVTVYSSELVHDFEDFDKNIKLVCKDLESEAVDSNCHIVIASNVLSNAIVFNNIFNTVRTDGCILLKENVEENVNIIEDYGLTLVSYMTHEDKCYVLLKKAQSFTNVTPLTISILSDSLNWLKKVQQIATQPAENILVLAKGDQVHDILNFIKSVKAEVKNKNIGMVITDDDQAPSFSPTLEFYHLQIKSNFPINVFKNGFWGTYLPVSLPSNVSSKSKNAIIGFDINQNATNITYVKGKPNSPKIKTICDIFSASLSLKDQSLITGKFFDIEGESRLGIEFAGYNGKEKVFGIVSQGALASSTVTDNDYLWNVPKNWFLEEASTVPFSYALGYYSLCLRGNLEKNDSILIVGTNSTAIASIYIAFQYNLDVFVLISEKSQQKLLKKLFLQIKDTQIITSKNNNFSIQVLQKTANKGVQIVLDTSLKRTYSLRAYISSLSENGKLIYFNSENATEELLGSAGNMRCITCHRIVASCLFENSITKTQISDLIKIGLKTGSIQPLPYVAFSDNELPAAFNSATEGDDSYKTIINIRNEQNSSNQFEKTFDVKPKVYFDNTKSYIILGGTVGFGLYVTNWMISQGANNLLLVCSEHELKTEQMKKMYLHKWKTLNVSITTIKSDNFNLKNCEVILKKTLQLGPIEGIFDFTAPKISDIKSVEILNENDFKKSNNKIDFVQNMDTASRKMCPDLKYFVSFSSVELQYGVVGYGSECFANGLIQNIIVKRKYSNLCATLIQWGNIGELENQTLYNNSKSLDLAPQPVNSALRVLHTFLESSEAVLSSYIINERTGSATHSIADTILEEVAKFLGIKDPSSVLPTLTMLELGLDSLIGTDIQQFLKVNYGVTLSTQEVRDLTFEKLRTLGGSL